MLHIMVVPVFREFQLSMGITRSLWQQHHNIRDIRGDGI